MFLFSFSVDVWADSDLIVVVLLEYVGQKVADNSVDRGPSLRQDIQIYTSHSDTQIDLAPSIKDVVFACPCKVRWIREVEVDDKVWMVGPTKREPFIFFLVTDVSSMKGRIRRYLDRDVSHRPTEGT